MSIHIVTDLGYGDAGKGTTVDYLSRQGDTVVIRHNGGPQAGHNVVLPDGTHHEFAQFGSGTFAGAKTYLSRFMLVNPLDMQKEWQHLYDLGQHDVWSRMYVDEEARIITPWHVAVNRQRERSRINRHGSCARGIGELMLQDLEAPSITLRVKDIRRQHLTIKLTALRDEMFERARLISDDIDPLFGNVRLVDELMWEYYRWHGRVNVVDEQWLRSVDDHNFVFEGAQGVLLDEWHGFYPYTTWSTTTHQNAFKVLEEGGFSESTPVTRLGVTRAYMTRHGAGPFVSQDDSLQFPEPHNTTGQWQGQFRQGHLDLLALDYAKRVCGGLDGLVVTHLDRSNNWRVVDQYRLDYGHGRLIDGIRVYPDHDLEAHQRLTNHLMTAHPLSGSLNGMDTEQLLGTLESIAPIHITSHGPTHADKRVRQESLV